MMHNSRYVLKQPFVGTVSKEEYIVHFRSVEFAPSSGNYGSDATFLNCFDNQSAHFEGVVDHDAAETYIDWSRSCSEEGS